MAELVMKKEAKKAVHTRTRRRFVIKPPTDEQEQNELVNELIWWVQKKDSYALEDFPISKSMAPSRFYRCAEDNEYFAEALDFARYTIGSRLQKGLRNKELDKDFVLRLLPLYNREYRSLMLDKIKQSKDEPQSITVVMDCYSSECQNKRKQNEMKNPPS